MFSHIVAGVSDFERAFTFYSALMQVLGNEARFCVPEKPWAGWQSQDRSRPYFVISATYDGKPHDPGNGQMIAFAAADRATVRLAFETALAHGGTSEGDPGLRQHYHPHYYGAYFRDTEGNKLCVVSHGETC